MVKQQAISFHISMWKITAIPRIYTKLGKQHYVCIPAMRLFDQAKFWQRADKDSPLYEWGLFEHGEREEMMVGAGQVWSQYQCESCEGVRVWSGCIRSLQSGCEVSMGMCVCVCVCVCCEQICELKTLIPRKTTNWITCVHKRHWKYNPPALNLPFSHITSSIYMYIHVQHQI